MAAEWMEEWFWWWVVFDGELWCWWRMMFGGELWCWWRMFGYGEWCWEMWRSFREDRAILDAYCVPYAYPEKRKQNIILHI